MIKVKFTAISLLCIFNFSILFSQGSPLDSIGFFEADTDAQVNIDVLGNLYILSDENLSSYNVYNQQAYQYSNRLLGSFDQLDSRNPLKIWLYNSGSGQMEILDKTLSPYSQFNLDQGGFDDVPVFCSAKTRGVWLYDDIQCKIYRTDFALQNLAVSVELSTLFDEDIEVLDILEIRNQLCLLVKDFGLLVFDNNANFIKKYFLPDSVQEINYFIGQIYYRDGDTFRYLNIHTGESGPIGGFKPEAGYTYQFNGNFMLKRNDQGVTVYACICNVTVVL